jgi:hypothetical protein
MPDRDQNTWIFNELEHERGEIEQEFGLSLNWERVLPNSGGCTIVVTRGARLIDSLAELNKLQEWLLATLGPFCQADMAFVQNLPRNGSKVIDFA